MRIDFAGANHWHVTVAAACNASEQRALFGPSGGDDPGVCQRKITSHGLLVPHHRLHRGQIVIHHQRHAAAAVAAVAVGAVGVEPGAGAGFEIGLGVVTGDEVALQAVEEEAVEQAR